ncbi:MAG: hypothetical protein MJ126_10725 [Lachnospiraceae bacterium]|nr:hypothetical protein [Lachnospiraceae bacterium]
MKKVLSIINIILIVLFLSACATNEKVIVECPFDISENAAIEQYPSNNLLGLTAIIEEEKEEFNTIILVFDKLGKNLNADNDDYTRIYGSGSMVSKSYYNFKFEEVEMRYSDSNLYVSLIYDKNIDLKQVDFPSGRVFLEEVGVAQYTFELDKSQIRTDYQAFDNDKLKWNKVSKEYMSLADEPQ